MEFGKQAISLLTGMAISKLKGAEGAGVFGGAAVEVLKYFDYFKSAFFQKINVTFLINLPLILITLTQIQG